METRRYKFANEVDAAYALNVGEGANGSAGVSFFLGQFGPGSLQLTGSPKQLDAIEERWNDREKLAGWRKDSVVPQHYKWVYVNEDGSEGAFYTDEEKSHSLMRGVEENRFRPLSAEEDMSYRRWLTTLASEQS